MAMYHRPYTKEEEFKIVEYIVNNEAFDCMKGDKVWMIMERENVLSRTWQSLKQHFRKRIIYDLYLPRYKLNQEVIQKFHSSFNKIVKKSRSRRKKPAENFWPTSSSETESDLEPPRIQRSANSALSMVPTLHMDISIKDSTGNDKRYPDVAVILSSTDTESDLEPPRRNTNAKDSSKLSIQPSVHNNKKKKPTEVEKRCLDVVAILSSSDTLSDLEPPRINTNKQDNSTLLNKPIQVEKSYSDVSASLSSSDTASDLEPPRVDTCVQATATLLREPSLNAYASDSENASSISNVETVFKVKDEDSESEYVVID